MQFDIFKLFYHDQHPNIDNLNGKCILAYLEKFFHFVLMFSFELYICLFIWLNVFSLFLFCEQWYKYKIFQELSQCGSNILMEAASCYSGFTVTSPTATCTKLHTANSLTAPIRLTFWMACTTTIEAIKYFEISLILCSKRVQFCNKNKRYMLFLRNTLTYNTRFYHFPEVKVLYR